MKFSATPEFYEKFRQQMRQNCEVGEDADVSKMIFTDDLRQFAHIAQSTPEDMTLLEKMMIKRVFLIVDLVRKIDLFW